MILFDKAWATTPRNKQKVLKKLHTALEFYATGKHFKLNRSCHGLITLLDRGEKAQAALEYEYTHVN